jgi:two-component system, NtrC family, sensor histidine kinase HydH
MPRLKTRLITLARGGLLLALLALGVTLVVSAWTNRREVEHMSTLLDRGQVERFFRPIPRLHSQNNGPATSEELAQLLAQFQGEGLRYLVEYDADGQVVSEAGQHADPERPRPDPASSQPQVVGERVRVTFRPPPNREELPILLMEFEPTVANQLRSRADKSFAFSSAASAALLALTLGLWLALRREERHRARNERERHLAALGEMSAVLAHEIRNPLASLKGHAQLLGEQLDAESPLQKKVARIVGEAKRLEELTSTLLDLVRASSVSRAPTDPAQLLRDAAEAVDGERIIVDAARAPETWPLDALRMDQVLKNLLQNAVQASTDQGRVEAAVALERGELVISVRDHGAGLPAGAAPRIFEAFHTTRVQGTGLGLAVARRIVELHGGQVRGENHPGGGAVFTLSIPG